MTRVNLSRWQINLRKIGGKLGRQNDFHMRGGMTLEVTLKMGDSAPDFSLPATTKEQIFLSDYKGNKNVLIAFYGMDFTPG